ncbi:MAG: HYR domain-containing protein, partial [Saprospirales bacterium]
MKRTDNQLLINKTKMNMNSGNLQVKRSPESIPRTLGNFLAGLSGKVLMLSAFMAVWAFSGHSLLNAQCGITPDPGDSVSVTFTLSPGASCVTLNNVALAGFINPDGGCNLYFTDDENPANGDPLSLTVTVCCDGSGDFDPGEPIYVYADDDGDFDAVSSVGPVILTINLIDNTGPTIDDSGADTPNDGDDFALDSGQDYVYETNALNNVGALVPEGCFAQLSWTHPDFSDNCLMDSLIISFSAGAGNEPDFLPTEIVIVGNGPIVAAGGDDISAEFWPSSTDGAATTVVTYRLVDEQGNESTYSFEVTVTDMVDPEITCPADVTVSTDLGVCSFTVPDDAWDAIATDNCAVVSLTHDQGTPDSTLQGIVFDGAVGGQITTVTWTAVDAQGNSVDCDFDVTVEDNEAPVILCPNQGLSGFAGPFDPANWTFDDGGGDGSVNTINAPGAITLIGSDDGFLFGPGVITTLCITIPASVDSVLFQFDYETFDIDGPALDRAGYILNGTLFQLTDDAGPDVQSGSETVLLMPGDDFCFYIDAWDNAGGAAEMTISNFATQFFGGFFFNTVSLCGYEVVGDTLDATATDNCDPDPVLTHDYLLAPDPNTLDGAFFPVGETTVVWTATDADMNASTCEMTVVVEDNEPPVIGDCPSDITVFTGPSACQQIASWTPPSDFTDNCALASLDVVAIGPDGDTLNIFNTNPGNCISILNYTNVFSPGAWSTPPSQTTGNADFDHTNTQLSVILDPSAPQETDIVTTSVLAPADFSGVVSMRVEQISNGLIPASGSSTVTISVDGNVVFSNMEMGSGVEFISFNLQEGEELEVEVEVANGILATGFAIVNIDNFSFICDNTQSNLLVELDTTTVYYYLTDIHDNVDTCSFTITLEDNVAPVANGQDVTVQVGAGQTINVPATAFD